jgi:hypothetical protein
MTVGESIRARNDTRDAIDEPPAGDAPGGASPNDCTAESGRCGSLIEDHALVTVRWRSTDPEWKRRVAKEHRVQIAPLPG